MAVGWGQGWVPVAAPQREQSPAADLLVVEVRSLAAVPAWVPVVAQ